MFSGNRSIAGVFCLIALAALSYGCQAGDRMFPTEAQRSLQTSVDADEVFAKIAEVITDPAVGASAKSQFQTIVKVYPKKPNDARAKAESLVDFIMKHFQAGKWEGADGTGELVAMILAYVDLIPVAQGATACIPGFPCTGEAETTENGFAEFAGAKIPGDLVNTPFVLLFTPNADRVVKPPLFGLVYDISTYPEGITFPSSSPGGSLTLAAEDDQPVAGVCTLLGPPDGVPVEGVHPDSLFVVHFENGVWERLPKVDITFLDCASAGETESALWSNPILEPILDFLSPSHAVALGTRTGGAITSFSDHATEVGGTLPTTTTLTIVGGGNAFVSGQSFTLRAEVYPEPPGGRVLFFATNPVSGPGAPAVTVVNGVATFTFVCGSNRVPATGSHTAQSQYTGFPSPPTEEQQFSGSVSGTLSYTCTAGG
ncbi:MAG TPA: hypothetical protein VJP59_01035 [Gemmatimonadota bacterium]|nr:hypothetical protein [Gemmatimonadota bacterium]